MNLAENSAWPMRGIPRPFAFACTTMMPLPAISDSAARRRSNGPSVGSPHPAIASRARVFCVLLDTPLRAYRRPTASTAALAAFPTCSFLPTNRGRGNPWTGKIRAGSPGHCVRPHAERADFPAAPHTTALAATGDAYKNPCSSSQPSSLRRSDSSAVSATGLPVGSNIRSHRGGVRAGLATSVCGRASGWRSDAPRIGLPRCRNCGPPRGARVVRFRGSRRAGTGVR